MRIVLNADDFGASADTVDATVAAFEAGVLTSATIMPTMPAAEAALAYARSRPDASFGVHLAFVGDGTERPASDPASLPALVDDHGRFGATSRTRARALLRLLPVDQIAREVEAQIALVRDAGVEVTHVDSHRHLHKLAPFVAALREVLPRFGIERVRTVQDVYLRRSPLAATYWLGSLWRRPIIRSFRTTDHFYMPASAGDLDWSEELTQIVAGLSGRTLEVGVHPGRSDWRLDEAESAGRFREEAERRGHEFVSWRAL